MKIWTVYTMPKDSKGLHVAELSKETIQSLRNLSQGDLFRFSLYILGFGIKHMKEMTKTSASDFELFNSWLTESKKIERSSITKRKELAFPLHIKPSENGLGDLSERTINKIRKANSNQLRKILTSLLRRELPHISVPEDVYIDYLFENYS